METVSKFTLNPLATCFVPSSMKYRSMSPVIFSVPSCEASVNKYTEARNRQFPTATKERSIGYLKVMKAQSSSVKAEIVGNPFVTIEEVKENHSDTVKMDETVKDPLITKPNLPIMNEMSGKETPVKSDDEKTSERNSKGSKDMETVDTRDMKIIGSKNTTLTKMDHSLLNQTIISKIFEYLKGGTKTLRMFLPFAVRSMLVMEFFYRMGLRTISLDMTMTSHMGFVFQQNSNALTYPNKDKIAKKRDSYEYPCNPVFGWATPFKDYVHTSTMDENLKLHPSEHSESKDSSKVNDEFTLEQCSLELKAVIKDVCDSLLSHDEDHDSAPKTRKRPVWETKTAKEIRRNSDVDLIDDGIHPLLQGMPEVDTEDTEIPKIQALLEQAFSLHNSGEILPSQSGCNPPCSVWCNKVPPPAKDAYKRFIRKNDAESTASSKKVTDVTGVRRSLYKRCFSADDTPKHYQDKMSFHSASSFESKERLLLLHKDPVAFIKQSRTSALNDTSHTSMSNFVCDQAAAKDNSTENNSDRWSLYDGADSKWQPLPDCIPSTDSAQKQAHRKARDMRRQKSVC